MIKRNLILQFTALGILMLVAVTAACSPDGSPVRTDCDIQRGPCVALIGSGTAISFDITPRPVRAMRDLLFTVAVSRNDRLISVGDVTLDLTMPGMIMGRNSPQLVPGKDGRYTGKGVIVRCPSGNKVWKAQVTVPGEQGVGTASFIFEVI